MLKYVIRRMLQLVPLLIFVSLVVFFMIRIIPGDPAAVMAGPNAPREAIEALRVSMKLDEPWYTQLGTWYWRLLRGDLGYSYFLHQPVTKALLQRLPATLGLTAGGVFVTLIVGLPLGICAAVRRGTLFDRASVALATLGLSLPAFWLAILMIMVFSVTLNLLPAGGALWARLGAVERLKALILPCVAAGAGQAAVITRLTRSLMIDVLEQEYVTVAQSKGLQWSRVVLKHALKNALVPVLSVVGTIVIGIFGGLVVIETVFTIPGFGRLIVTSVLTRDYPVIQGSLIFAALFYSVVNLAIDVACGSIDPRIRYE